MQKAAESASPGDLIHSEFGEYELAQRINNGAFGVGLKAIQRVKSNIQEAISERYVCLKIYFCSGAKKFFDETSQRSVPEKMRKKMMLTSNEMRQVSNKKMWQEETYNI